jgi:excisionase family DNA binding protein
VTRRALRRIEPRRTPELHVAETRTPFAEQILALVRAIVGDEVTRQLDEREQVPEWLTIEQAAKRYALTAAALRKRAQRGQVPHVRDGRRLLFERRALDTALTRATVGRRRPRPPRGEEEGLDLCA